MSASRLTTLATVTLASNGTGRGRRLEVVFNSPGCFWGPGSVQIIYAARAQDVGELAEALAWAAAELAHDELRARQGT